MPAYYDEQEKDYIVYAETETAPLIEKIRVMPNYYLLLWFENGEEKSFNAKPLIEKNKFFAHLIDEQKFKKAHVVRKHFVAFDDETDISCEVLYHESKPVLREYQIQIN